MTLLADIAKDPKRALFIVTHDPRIMPFADWILRIEDGRIVSDQSAASATARYAPSKSRARRGSNVQNEAPKTPIFVTVLVLAAVSTAPDAQRSRRTNPAGCRAPRRHRGRGCARTRRNQNRAEIRIAGHVLVQIADVQVKTNAARYSWRVAPPR